jgi:broad specificity phosphatase PhoE
MNAPRAPKWPLLLVVMRHAESEANERREYLNKINSTDTHLDLGKRDVDVALTERGHQQARATGRYLHAHYPPFDSVYVSPYRRTRQTSERALAEFPGSPGEVIIEERLREKEFGILEGLTKHGIVTLRPEEHARKKMLGKYYYRPPGGESYPDVNLRVHSFLGTLVRERAGGRVLVVTHSVVVLCFRRLLERMVEHEVLDLDRRDEVRNASLLVYEPGVRDGGTSIMVRRAWNLTPWDETGD